MAVSRVLSRRGVFVRRASSVFCTALLCGVLPVSPAPGGGSAYGQAGDEAAAVEYVLPADLDALSPEALTSEIRQWWEAAYVNNPDPAANIGYQWTGQEPAAQQLQALIAHAWDQYLSDPVFVAEGNWAVLIALAQQIKPSVEIAGVDAVSAEDLTLLGERLLARVETVSAAVPGTQWERFEGVLGELHRLGVGSDALTQLRARWYTAQGISALPLHKQLQLYRTLSVPVVDAQDMTAVYDGWIELPQTTEYRFSRHLHERPVPGDWVVVRVGGEVVLDTRLDEHGRPRVVGGVALAAGPQPFEAYFYRRDASAMTHGIHPPPEHVLLWEGVRHGGQGVSSRRLISEHLLTQPDGEGAGLRARYYEGASEDVGGQTPALETVVRRLDHLDRSFGHRHGMLVVQLKHQMLRQLLEGRAADDPVFQGRDIVAVTAILPGLTCTERSVLADRLCADRSGWLQGLKIGSPLFRNFLKAPGDAGVRVLAAWVQDQPLLCTQVGSYLKAGTYRRANDEPYQDLGRELVGYDPRLEKLAMISEQYLSDAEGGCSLPMMRVFFEGCEWAGAWPSPQTGTLEADAQDPADAPGAVPGEFRGFRGDRGQVLGLIDAMLADPALPGDCRATWLVARGWCDEFKGYRHPDLSAGRRWYELAFAAAESDEMRFWAMGEQAARLASMGDSGRLEALLAGAGQGFGAEDQLACIAGWREDASALRTEYRRRGDSQALRRHLDLIRGLERRLQRAQGDGHAGACERYQALLDEAVQGQAALLADYEAKWPPADYPLREFYPGLARELYHEGR